MAESARRIHRGAGLRTCYVEHFAGNDYHVVIDGSQDYRHLAIGVEISRRVLADDPGPAGVAPCFPGVAQLGADKSAVTFPELLPVNLSLCRLKTEEA